MTKQVRFKEQGIENKYDTHSFTHAFGICTQKPMTDTLKMRVKVGSFKVIGEPRSLLGGGNIKWQKVDQELNASVKVSERTSVIMGRLGIYSDVPINEKIVVINDPELIKLLLQRAVDDYRKGFAVFRKSYGVDPRILATVIQDIKLFGLGIFRSESEERLVSEYPPPQHAIVFSDHYKSISAVAGRADIEANGSVISMLKICRPEIWFGHITFGRTEAIQLGNQGTVVFTPKHCK